MKSLISTVLLNLGLLQGSSELDGVLQGVEKTQRVNAAFPTLPTV